MFSVEVFKKFIIVVYSLDIIGDITCVESSIKKFVKGGLIIGEDIFLDVIIALEELFIYVDMTYLSCFLQCLRCWSAITDDL